MDAVLEAAIPILFVTLAESSALRHVFGALGSADKDLDPVYMYSRVVFCTVTICLITNFQFSAEQSTLVLIPQERVLA